MGIRRLWPLETYNWVISTSYAMVICYMCKQGNNLYPSLLLSKIYGVCFNEEPAKACKTDTITWHGEADKAGQHELLLISAYI